MKQLSIDELIELRKEPEWFRAKRNEAKQLIETTKLPSFQKIKYHDWDINVDGTSVIDDQPKFDTNADVYQYASNKAQIKLPSEFLDKGVIVEDLDVDWAASELLDKFNYKKNESFNTYIYE